MEKSTFCDNAVVHFYPYSPFVARCAVNLRRGKRIVLRVLLKDNDAVTRYLSATFPEIPVKLVAHFCDDVQVKKYI